MTRETVQKLARAARALARRQHYVITREQLLVLGYSAEAIDHCIEKGRLHPVHAGVYAVDRPELTREGYLIAAVLACGEGAALSHDSAAELWGIRPVRRGRIHVSVSAARDPRRRGIRLYRRTCFEVTRHKRIPVTTPICTLADLATRLDDEQLERAVNEAINRDLTDPERLGAALAKMPYRRGVRRLLRLLGRDTYVVTDTRLGYHRTPSQQAKDRLRDQRHAAAGLTTLRFTHWQVFHDPLHVEVTLRAVYQKLADSSESSSSSSGFV